MTHPHFHHMERAGICANIDCFVSTQAWIINKYWEGLSKHTNSEVNASYSFKWWTILFLIDALFNSKIQHLPAFKNLCSFFFLSLERTKKKMNHLDFTSDVMSLKRFFNFLNFHKEKISFCKVIRCKRCSAQTLMIFYVHVKYLALLGFKPATMPHVYHILSVFYRFKWNFNCLFARL